MTDTINHDDFCHIGFNINDYNISTNNAISLWDLVKNFIVNYNLFIIDYQNLTKLKLGDNIEIIRFNKTNAYRYLEIYIADSSICNINEAILHIYQDKEQISTWVTSCGYITDKDYFSKQIELEQDTVIAYLNLFCKYSTLLEQYHYLKKSICLWRWNDNSFYAH